MHHENSEIYIEAILHSPDAPQVVANLQNRLEHEHQRREQFYADIDDDMKVEFINGEVIVHSPVKKEHTDATGFLYKVLDTFVRLAKLGYVGYEKVMSAFTRNDYDHCYTLPLPLFFPALGSEKSVSKSYGTK